MEEERTETLREVDLKKARFSKAPWFDRALASSAVVGGAGNIGSWVSFFLARQGVTLFVYDFDLVDESNLAAQLYKQSDISNLKTEALERTILDYVDPDVVLNGKFNQMEKFEKNSMVDNYCFSCFDNMEARKNLFEAWVAHYGNSEDAIFIDGRILFAK